MNLSILKKYNGPTWTEYYPSGTINLKNEDLPTLTNNLMAHDATVDAITSILKKGNNTPNNTDIVEEYTEQGDEEFIMQGHADPIWVLLFFLFTIWAIFLIGQLSV